MRLVLDTNVVLDLLYWHDPAAAPLLAALGDGTASAVTDARCFAELEQVLRLDRFGLDGAARQALALRYRALCRWHETAPAPARSLPRCKDADDQKFLELALDAAAGLLVTKDKALLALARRRRALGTIAIVAPPAAAQRLAELAGAGA
jgi:putative PIN family toxin of toxin-antitoxin system